MGDLKGFNMQLNIEADRTLLHSPANIALATVLIFYCYYDCCFQLKFYTYNWCNDTLENLKKQMTKVIKWNNARCHLLSNVVIQKCGLFNHTMGRDISHSLVCILFVKLCSVKFKADFI